MNSKPSPQESFSDWHFDVRRLRDENRILRRWIKRLERKNLRLRQLAHVKKMGEDFEVKIITPEEVQREYSEGDYIENRTPVSPDRMNEIKDFIEEASYDPIMDHVWKEPINPDSELMKDLRDDAEDYTDK